MPVKPWEKKLDNLVQGSGVRVVYDAPRGKERLSRGVVHMPPKPRKEADKAEWGHDLLRLVTLAQMRKSRGRR